MMRNRMKMIKKLDIDSKMPQKAVRNVKKIVIN